MCVNDPTASPPTSRTTVKLAFRRIVVFAATAAVVGCGGIAAAAATSGSNTIHACSAKSGGALRLASSKGCPKGYSKVSWNVAGARGATGPKGAAGPKGDTGRTGLNGDPGAQGPGIDILHFVSTTIGTSTTLTVDGWKFVSVCSRGGANALAELEVEPPAGVSFRAYGTEFDYSGPSGAITETGLDDASTTSADQVTETYGSFAPSTVRRVVLSPATFVASSGPSFAVDATIVDDNSANLPTTDRLCSVDGTVTPTVS